MKKKILRRILMILMATVVLVLITITASKAQGIDWGSSNYYWGIREYYPSTQADVVEHDKTKLMVVRTQPYSVFEGFSFETPVRASELNDYVDDYAFAFNMNMYSHDGHPMSYAKINGSVIKSSFTSGYNGILAWGHGGIRLFPSRSAFDEDRWDNAVSLIRMVIDGKVRWQKQPQNVWSVITVAETYDDRIIVIHARDGWEMNRFCHMAIEELNVKHMFYLEGGPEATLAFGNGSYWVGSYETGFYDSFDNIDDWSLPNWIILR